MSITHTINYQWSRGVDVLPAKTVAITADQEINLDAPIPGPSTAQEVDFALLTAQIESLYIVSTLAMTIKTNDSGSPDDTITLAANTPVIWFTGCGYSIPVAHDTTKIYVDLSGSVAGTLTIRALVNTVA